MVNSHTFIAQNLTAKTKGIKSFGHTFYIKGEVRKRLWLSVMQRVEFCRWCIEHGYTTVANYDPSSFSKWEIQAVGDPIDVFNHNLKLKQDRHPIDYQLIYYYLQTVADRLAGINGSKLDHPSITVNPLVPYCMSDLSGLQYEQDYMVKLWNYKNPFPI